MYPACKTSSKISYINKTAKPNFTVNYIYCKFYYNTVTFILHDKKKYLNCTLKY